MKQTSVALPRREAGMVSLLITIIMLAVITLIVIGFTQVANRNRRQTLDRQLSSQAFYAAESGVNMVANYIAENQGDPSKLPVKSKCSDSGYGYTTTSAKLDSSGTVVISCVLVNPIAQTVETTASASKPTVVPIFPSDANGSPLAAKTLSFSWTASKDSSGSVKIDGCTQPLGQFIDTYTNCSYGLLRVDLFQSGANTTATDMAANTIALYLQPVRDLDAATNKQISEATITDIANGPKAYIVKAHCDYESCTATVTMPGSTADYYARFVTYYNDAPNVSIDGTSAVSSTTSLHFRGQYVIDVTGRAQDVLRRVAVRYSMVDTGSTINPIAGVQAGGGAGGSGSETAVCKLLTVKPDKVDNDGCL